MRIIGLLGGVAAGKSMVAGMFAELGAGVLDADRAAHEALRRPDVEQAVRRRWGEAVFGSDGRVDRRRLAKVVFKSDPNGGGELKFLESLVHPVAGELVAQQARALADAGVDAAILDSPLLLEAGWDKLCERLVFVDAPREARLARALVRGWSETEFAAREAAQHSLDRKRQRADVVIDNSGTSEQTRTLVRRAWEVLVG